ncbi:unnamed protein product [Darwinula stevensoni]|uniref:G-protein coupled receptors family 1 profile domain-containing protein n=1 Tax=Darwinula stevensoni TaxID=69355 RepID=A0A7R9AED4_9CRUS|nr:unnamed protein product [Darwinula stevensoni]CAG0902263.1 unnamed protein product [Darwinula stevensoni]
MSKEAIQPVETPGNSGSTPSHTVKKKVREGCVEGVPAEGRDAHPHGTHVGAREWPLGWFLCKFSSFFANASVAASINSLLAVAVDRLLAICFPSKPQLTKKAAAAAIAVIWLSSLCVSLPWLIYSETFESEGGSTHCIDAWPSTETKWTIFLLGPVVFGYFIPSFLISLCCLFIWMEDSWGRIPTEAGDATASKFRRGQEEVLAVKMLVEVTVVFLISWAPRFGLEVVIGFQETFFWENEDVGIYAILFADCLGLSASFVKPILYAFRDEKLRDGVLAVLRSRCCY